MGAEQRIYPRLPITLAVRYGNESELVSAYIGSLSHGGVFIRTTRPLPVGTELNMEIQLDGATEREIRIRGRVVWGRVIGRNDGMGVQFVDPLPDDLRSVVEKTIKNSVDA